MKTTIKGVFTTVSPMHVASPQPAKFNLDKWYSMYGTSGEGFPYVRTQTLKVVIPQAFTEEVQQLEDQDAKTKSPVFYVPVMPANDIRGRIRRKTAKILFDVLEKKGEKLSLGTYHGITCGSVTSQPSMNLTVQSARASMANVWLGTFGGGPRLINTAFNVSTGILINHLTIRAGMVDEKYSSYSSGIKESDVLQTIFFSKIDDILRFRSKDGEGVIKDYKKSVEEWQGMCQSNTKKRKSDDNSAEKDKKTSLQSFLPLEIIIPNVSFYVEFIFNDEGPGVAGLGLFLLGLKSFITDQGFGGWVRNGFGRFKSNLEISQNGTPATPLFNQMNGEYEFNMSSPGVSEALDAWAESSQKVTAAELEELFSIEEK